MASWLSSMTSDLPPSGEGVVILLITHKPQDALLA
jgi:hypothetical protein